MGPQRDEGADVAQQCAGCRSVNPDGAKFCLECGTALARVCRSCGAPVVAGKFCGECGAPLAAGSTVVVADADAPISERRNTSVLFGDLVSFTTLSESRDPDEVRELLSTYFATARTVVSRYGGTIEKFIGDAVMAVWGVPVAHEDDAERAVRAGLDLAQAVAVLGESVGAPGLAMRVGVVTGPVAVTLGALQEGMVAGDAVNTAARVQAAADPGAVWVDDPTRALAAAAVAFSDQGEHVLKGKAEPLRLFRADAVVAAIGGAQRVDGLEAPLAGRDRELRQVKDLFHATEEDGRARVVLVSGVAGIGKSRIGWEFFKYIDGLSYLVRWHRGRCLSYGEGVAFWAFAEMMRSRLGILESDDRAEVDDKIRVGVTGAARDDEEAGWLQPRLAALLSPDRAAGFERTDLFAAWTVFLDRIAGDGPLALVFEDAQHAEPALLDLVEHLLETSQASLFVLVLGRPEIEDRRPSLAGGRRATRVYLEPLADVAMADLIDGLVDDLPARARSALVARAEGVPLYAVETVRSLIDRDAVVPREGRYVYVDHDGSRVDLGQLAAPSSLQTLIAARLDALSPIERRVAQDASVLGLSFSQEGIAALTGVRRDDLTAGLDGLVRKGVIEVQRDPRSPELGSYRFLQALVRQVAYGTLARKDRKARHLSAATQLEGSGEIADDLAGIIAQHYLDALDASPPGDPDRQHMQQRAGALLTIASARAESLGSPQEALRCCLSAMALDPDDTERADLLLRAARTAALTGDLQAAEQYAGQAVTGYAELGLDLAAAEALAEQGRAMVNLGRAQEGIELLTPTYVALSSRVDADEVLLRLAMVLALGSDSTGDLAANQRHALLALRLADCVDNIRLRMDAMTLFSVTLFRSGAPSASTALMREALAIAREHRLLTSIPRQLGNLASERYPRDLAAAVAMATEAVEVARRLGDRFWADFGLLNLCLARWLTGDWDALVREVADNADGGVPTFQSHLRVIRGWVQLARGEAVPASVTEVSDNAYVQLSMDLYRAIEAEAGGDLAAAAVEAAGVVRRAFGDGTAPDDFEVIWTYGVEVQLRAVRIDEAAALVALVEGMRSSRRSVLASAQLLRMQGLLAAARGDDAEALLRSAEAAFVAYKAPFYLARTRLELARWLADHDRRDDAAALLALAAPAFAQLRAAPSLAELEQVSVGLSALTAR